MNTDLNLQENHSLYEMENSSYFIMGFHNGPSVQCTRWSLHYSDMVITLEPMVRFGPNFAGFIIFEFHCHLKGKVFAVKSKAKEILTSWDIKLN